MGLDAMHDGHAARHMDGRSLADGTVWIEIETLAERILDVANDGDD